MQHPDEGTIHAWLDGALSAEEAAQIDAHVKECAECAAAVAEARGFIAASSRILTALDNAPRGVIPAVAPVKKRFDPLVWRVAASVLVIAGVTLIVVQNQGSRQTPMSARTPTVDTSVSDASFKAAAESAPTPTAPSATAAVVPLSLPTVTQSRRATQPSAAAAVVEKPNGSIGNRGDLAPRPAPPTQNTAQMAEKSVTATGAGADRVAAVPAPTPRFLPSAAAPAREGVIAGATAGPTQALKLIGSPGRIGANVTVYEIGGDTVTFTESQPVALSSIVASDAAAAGAPSESRGKTAAVQNRVSSQMVPASAPPVAPPPPAATPVQDAARPEDPNVVHTITWMDPVTRNMLSLSGRMSEARLQLIRLRIEKERAAAKKTP